jgi:hypothetical protein
LRKSYRKTYVGGRERKLQERGENCAMRSLIISTLPSIIMEIRLRSMRWWFVLHLLGEIRNENKFLV